MANLLTQLFSTGASSLVEAVGDAIDKNVTSDEERLEMEHEIAKASMIYDLETARIGIQKDQVFLADTDSARVNQSRVQESEHASWLAKNIQPILALVIIALTFVLFYWIIFSEVSMVSEKKEIVIYILGALTTISSQVAAFFFGSSSGSKEKTQLMSRRRKRGE